MAQQRGGRDRSACRWHACRARGGGGSWLASGVWAGRVSTVAGARGLNGSSRAWPVAAGGGRRRHSHPPRGCSPGGLSAAVVLRRPQSYDGCKRRRAGRPPRPAGASCAPAHGAAGGPSEAGGASRSLERDCRRLVAPPGGRGGCASVGAGLRRLCGRRRCAELRAVRGPRLDRAAETPAEASLALGSADVVGMSTAPEVRAAAPPGARGVTARRGCESLRGGRRAGGAWRRRRLTARLQPALPASARALAATLARPRRIRRVEVPAWTS